MRMQQAWPDAALKASKNSSHMPFYEEPETYFAVPDSFLNANPQSVLRQLA